MTKYLTLFILFLFSYLAAQQPLPVFDGVVTEEEWKEAESFTINYEIWPGNNTPSPHITRAFITYSETDLYVGFIALTNINYQFNANFSLRLIGEFNEFNDAFFIQPLLKWNPNPFTIFYIGGTNGYSSLEPEKRYAIDNSQVYLKFQYLIDF